MFRLMKLFLVVGIILWAIGSSTLHGLVNDGWRGAVSPKAAASTTDQSTFDRVCPLFEVWTDLDHTGKKRTGDAIASLAAQGARRTEDPAVKAFLVTVPVALADANSRQSRAARDLVRRECAAHGWR